MVKRVVENEEIESFLVRGEFGYGGGCENGLGR
jgi:hypothetical protein